MSQTVYVGFRGRGFWAYDVATSVLLKHLIDAASARIGESEKDWLDAAISHWRVNAVVSDYALFLDDDWSARQIQTVTELIDEACRVLDARTEIPAFEVTSWRILEDESIRTRGIYPIATQPIVRLGSAISALLQNTLEEPPAGSWWLFGVDAVPGTIPKCMEP